MRAPLNNSIPELGHQLRNLLAVIISSIDLIQLKGQLNEEDKQILTVMQDKVKEVNRVLNDLLTISQIPASKNDLKNSL